MKRSDISSAVDQATKVATSKKVLRVAKIVGAGLAGVFMALRVRKELYGPGGTKLSRNRRRRK
jgi:NADH dehydrogenase FAD-containing subunit